MIKREKVIHVCYCHNKVIFLLQNSPLAEKMKDPEIVNIF